MRQNIVRTLRVTLIVSRKRDSHYFITAYCTKDKLVIAPSKRKK